MKYNKGFIGIGMIIAIIAILAVGGGAVYYATKTPTPSSNTEENNYPVNQNQNSTTPTNTQTQNSNPSSDPISTPTITVVSPNGGETLGQNSARSISWSYTGLNKGDLITVALRSTNESPCWIGTVEVSRGSYSFTPSQVICKGDIPGSVPNLKNGGQYKAQVIVEKYADGRGVADTSDNYFTITPSTATTQTYNSTQYGFSIQHPTGTQISDVDISGGRSIFFTTSQGTLIVQVVTQAWNNGVLSSPPNCNDTASGADRTNTNINGVNFVTFSMSKEMSGMNSPASATEYCAIRNGVAYKLITKVGYTPGSSNGLNLDKNPTLNSMVASFKLI